MSLSKWYDDAPIAALRWINRYRYGWIVIAALLVFCVAAVGLAVGWFVGQTRR